MYIYFEKNSLFIILNLFFNNFKNSRWQLLLDCNFIRNQNINLTSRYWTVYFELFFYTEKRVESIECCWAASEKRRDNEIYILNGRHDTGEEFRVLMLLFDTSFKPLHPGYRHKRPVTWPGLDLSSQECAPWQPMRVCSSSMASTCHQSLSVGYPTVPWIVYYSVRIAFEL